MIQKKHNHQIALFHLSICLFIGENPVRILMHSEVVSNI